MFIRFDTIHECDGRTDTMRWWKMELEVTFNDGTYGTDVGRCQYYTRHLNQIWYAAQEVDIHHGRTCTYQIHFSRKSKMATAAILDLEKWQYLRADYWQ